MTTLSFDIFVAGGGAAGMAAALAASEKGFSVLLVEREPQLGGILNRCIHQGFGLGYFEEDLTGTEYAERFRRQVVARMQDSGHDGDSQLTITVMTDTSILSVSKDRTALLSSSEGLFIVHFDQCILATGSYERTLESIPVAGTRPAGVYSAGCAQGLINEGGYDIGDQIVILGSGNVGQIMARQLKAAGKTILAMLEINDHPGGIARNIRECIEAYDIPLHLKTTITEIHGADRICGVTVRNLKTGEETYLPCDTLITALGLIPDRALIKDICPTPDSNLPDWLHLCGNCESIHDFVDTVSAQGEQIGQAVCAKI